MNIIEKYMHICITLFTTKRDQGFVSGVILNILNRLAHVTRYRRPWQWHSQLKSLPPNSLARRRDMWANYDNRNNVAIKIAHATIFLKMWETRSKFLCEIFNNFLTFFSHLKKAKLYFFVLTKKTRERHRETSANF